MSDELLDIVNDDDVVIAQEMRSIVHSRGLQHRGVHVFLVTPQGKLLVQRRGRQQAAFPLALDCSVSEHVKAGENYRQAAKRGMEEELGINAIQVHAMVKFKMTYGPNDFEICVLYEGSVDPAQVRFNPLEVQGIAYYELEELEALIHNGGIPFSSWFEQLLNWYQRKLSEMKILKSYKHDRLMLLMRNKR